MFGLKLLCYRKKKDITYWLMGKLNNKLNKFKTVEELVYKDILHTFAYNEDGYYRLYMKNSPIEFLDLETIIQEIRGDHTPVNEVDLAYEYMFTKEYLNEKFVWHPNVKVFTGLDNYGVFMEIQYKNYKQDK